MNKNWIDFLKSYNATLNDNSEIIFSEDHQVKAEMIAAIAHLAIIKVTGKDAAQFLQGQLTCNIHELTESTSYFTAFCNAKGRTISTLLILKRADIFLMILPEELVEKVINKLQMYILRSDVQLLNATDEYCLTAITTENNDFLTPLPAINFAVTSVPDIIIRFPSDTNRYLIISSVSHAKALWTQLTQNPNIAVCNSKTWDFQDISASIPWLTSVTSEEYIPQMLNIDKLGGISFNKGCYTGQEIIARTHYLGKAKRQLFLTECCNTAIIDCDTQIITKNNEQPLGKLLSLQSNGQNIRMLIVMPTEDAGLKSLMLNNPNQDKINIIDFQ